MPDLQQATAAEIIISQPSRPRRYAVADDGRIAAAGAVVAEVGDAITTPGLVDLQVNGFGGVDFNADGLTADALDRALTAMLATGVTRCLPTIITAPADRLKARLQALDAAVRDSRLGPFMVAGIHLEGPFLSPEDGYAGCHPKHAMRLPTIAAYDELTGGLGTPVVLTTIAPERAGAVPFIRELVARGVVVALGHTHALRDDILKAADAGAAMSTHLGNAISHQLEKNDNPLFAQLGEDRLTAGLIADGIHIPPYMLQSWIRAKTTGRVVLVTDATAAAAAEPGKYTLGDLAIERGADGVVREPGSPYLAGSCATLDGCLWNVMHWFGYDFATVFRMVRDTPLSILGRAAEPRTGDIAECVDWRRADTGWQVAGARVGPWQIAPISSQTTKRQKLQTT